MTMRPRASRFGMVMAIVAGLSGVRAPAAPLFTNAGFEDDGPAYNTSANNFKTPITGWSVIGSSGDAGVMYYTNDAFTSGTGYRSQIAGMRSGRGITQAVSGFQPGTNYVIVWEGNIRNISPASFLTVSAGDHVVWSDGLPFNSGSFLTYTSRPFTATGSVMTVSFQNQHPTDVTTLIDNLLIQETDQPPVSPIVDLMPLTFSGSAVYAILDGYGIPPYEGPHYLRLQNAASGRMTLRELEPGKSYVLSFYARNRSASAPNDFRVRVGDHVYLGGPGFTVSGTVWTNLSFPFTATGATLALTFEALFTAGGDRTIGIDAITIQETVLPLSVRSLAPANLGTNRATLRGLLDSDGGGDSPEVVFCLGTEDFGSTSTSAWPRVISAGTGWEVAELIEQVFEGLDSGTTYCYRCWATNSTGSAWSESLQTFTTLYLPILQAPDVKPDSTWAVVESTVLDTGGEPPFLWAHYGIEGGAITSVMAIGTTSNAFSVVLTDLQTGSTYRVTIQASNSAGSVWTDALLFTTLSMPAFGNPAFEEDGPQYNQTFNSFRTPVAQWTVTGSVGEAGIMYCSNDAFTAGTGFRSQFLGMRQGRGVQQTVTGFSPGQRGRLVFEGNCRLGTPDAPLLILADDHVIWSDLVLGHSSFLTYTSHPFQAGSTGITFTLQAPSFSDVTVFLDTLRLIPTDSRVTPFMDPIGPLTGGAFYQRDIGYGAPVEPPFCLRMTGSGTAAMTARELQAGRGYTFAWMARNRDSLTNDFRVRVDGAVLVGGPGYCLDGVSWTNLAVPFTATGTTAAILFEAFGSEGSDRTLLFDTFRVDRLPPQSGTLIQIR